MVLVTDIFILFNNEFHEVHSNSFKSLEYSISQEIQAKICLLYQIS